MFVQRVTSGGQDCYVGALPLSFLKQAYDHSSPTLQKEKIFPQLEQEEKAIHEISKLIVDHISTGQPWWMGGFSFAIFSFPPFQPLPSGYDDPPGIWGTLPLTGSGSEVWMPLDGYQRMLGMFQALSVLSWKHRQTLAENRVPVLLIPDPPFQKCQELLLRMHKSTRATDRGETIRTKINDDYALYARWIMGEDKEHHPGVIEKDLINWKSNTLTSRLCKFSTLSVLYDSARMFDLALKHDPLSDPTDKTERYNEIAEIWSLLLERFTHFQKAVDGNPKLLPSLREKFLCLKPTGQLVIAAVIARALPLQNEFPLEQVIERLNKVPWDMNNPIWRNIIVVEGRINGTKAAITLTSHLIAHLIGLPLSDVEIVALEESYCKGKPGENRTLPNPIFPLWDQQEI